MKSVYSSTTVIEEEPLEGTLLLEGGGGGLMEGQLESPGSGGTPVPQWELISVTKFVWDGWNLTAELNGEDEIVRTYAWGLDLSNSEQGAGGVGGLLFEQDGDGGPIHRVSMDGNGNVMTLRDSTGALIAGYEYGPFGEALTVRGSYAGINPFRFSTKYNDSESGLYYYGYRYYSTGMGRWISRDPIEEQGGLNTNGFLKNNALANIDPTGLRPISFAFNAFINSRLGAWLPEPGTSGLFAGTRFELGGDNRPFGYFNFAKGPHANARMYSIGSIESTRIGRPGLGVATATNGTGWSHRRRKTVYQRDDGIVDWYWEYEERQAQLDKNKVAYRATGYCQSVVRIRASSAYAFLAPSWALPNIDWDIEFVFTARNDDTIDVEVWGWHNNFPDYEAYVDGTGPRSLFYTRASPDSGPGLANVGWQKVRFISSTQNVPGPVPEECKCKSNTRICIKYYVQNQIYIDRDRMLMRRCLLLVHVVSGSHQNRSDHCTLLDNRPVSGGRALRIAKHPHGN